MSGLLLPLVAWGDAETISVSPWASVGTPIVTAGQADPFGRTDASRIEDDDGGIAEARFRTLGALSGTSHTFAVMARAGTATTSRTLFYDFTDAAIRGYVDLVWSGGVPTATFGGGTGSVIGTIPIGGGWYLVVYIVAGLTSGNTYRQYLYGASGAGATTGTTYWYLRNLVLLDYPDDDKAWDNPPPGSERVRAPSGIVDRWIPGGRRDYRFKGTLRWIPSAPRAFPQIVSGWEGNNESIGVNCGVRAMLKAASEGNDLIWVPDRSNCAVNIPSDLVEPFDKETYDTENAIGDRKVQLELVNTTTPYPTVL